MSVPIKSQPVDLPPETFQIARRTIGPKLPKHRSTMTPNNAARFRSVFDDMIATRKDQSIDGVSIGLRPSTLYVCANEALGFLCTTEPQKYQKLRDDISMRKTEDGLILYFKRNLKAAIGNATTNLDQWKEKISYQIAQAKEGEIVSGAREMSSEDQEWLRCLCLEKFHGCEYEITATTYRIMR